MTFEQVEWTMQVQDGDTTDAIEAGYSEGDYTTYELEEEVPPTLLLLHTTCMKSVSSNRWRSPRDVTHTWRRCALGGWLRTTSTCRRTTSCRWRTRPARRSSGSPSTRATSAMRRATTGRGRPAMTEGARRSRGHPPGWAAPFIQNWVGENTFENWLGYNFPLFPSIFFPTLIQNFPPRSFSRCDVGSCGKYVHLALARASQ